MVFVVFRMYGMNFMAVETGGTMWQKGESYDDLNHNIKVIQM